MSSPRTLRAALVGLLALLAVALPHAATPAFAGCGCDHPPPAFAPVLPPFGSAGKTLQLHTGTVAFEVGETVQVRFKAAGQWFPLIVAGQVIAADTIEVSVPRRPEVLPRKVKVEVTT